MDNEASREERRKKVYTLAASQQGVLKLSNHQLWFVHKGRPQTEVGSNADKLLWNRGGGKGRAELRTSAS